MLTATDLVNAHLYHNEEAVIQDAIRHLLRARPELRIDMAVYRYRNDNISLAKAAELAGVSGAQIREILLEKGLTPRLGAETVVEAANELAVLHKNVGNWRVKSSLKSLAENFITY
jgi:predicted HTH domain antitoxin